MIAAIIRKLPAPAEFCLVLLVCAWWAILASMMSIANHSWSSSGRVTGIGIELGEQNQKIIIVQVLPNTPASKAGLSDGLVIQKIDGTVTGGKLLQDCGDMMRGPAGSKVKLELADLTQNKTSTVELTRETFQGPPPTAEVGDSTALTVVIIELLGMAVTFWIARIRGWPLGAWGFRPTWRLTGAGILLCLFTTLIIGAIAVSTNAIFPGTLNRHSVSHLSLPVLVLFGVINSVFEETLETGYFVQSLQKYGMWSALLASAIFRAFLHAYQGIGALALIFPLGLIFGFVYWKWRRLWPLYVAHVLFDLYAYFPGWHV